MWYMGNVKIITRTKQTWLVKTTCSNSSNSIVSSSAYEALAMCYASFSTGIQLSGKSVHHVNVSFHACHHVKNQTLLTRCPRRPCGRETDQERRGKGVGEGILKMNHSSGQRLGLKERKKQRSYWKDEPDKEWELLLEYRAILRFLGISNWEITKEI